MSKELEALDHLRKGVQYINQDESPAFISQYEEDIDIVEQKFSQLEEIEEELGVDLLTLFKVLKNGIYVKEVDGKIKYYNPDQIAINWVGLYTEIVFLDTAKNGNYCALNTNAYRLRYTPTWALRKEELE